jgi:hypothetical protein
VAGKAKKREGRKEEGKKRTKLRPLRPQIDNLERRVFTSSVFNSRQRRLFGVAGGDEDVVLEEIDLRGETGQFCFEDRGERMRRTFALGTVKLMICTSLGVNLNALTTSTVLTSIFVFGRNAKPD